MPYRYTKRQGGGQYFYVWNTGFAEKTLFRGIPDYRHFIQRLETGAQKTPDCRVIAFCLLRNQYHLVVEEAAPGAIASYMHRLNVAYATYFNSKYQQAGKLFKGPYKDLQLQSDEEMMIQIARIARLPEQLGFDIHKYQWSSLRAYSDDQRIWLHKTPIQRYFATDDNSALRAFVQSVESPNLTADRSNTGTH